jgi:cytochrome P450 family 3 subfamily A
MVEHEREESDSSNNKASQHLEDDSGVKWNYMKNTLSNKEVLAQAILFLLAGYETSGSSLTMISYNLACYPECQEKLIDEIDGVLEKHNGLSYEAVNDMPFMDMVIEETLRLYPPVIRIDRVCNRDYEYGGIKIPKGQIITVPIWALHHDPELYPDPYQFDPERFNEENKKNRPNEAFIPFGTGPRICIGIYFNILNVQL